MGVTVYPPNYATLGSFECPPVFAQRPSWVESRINWVDMALICIFLLGLYTNYTIYLSPKVPFPSAPSGIAGVLLLWRRRADIKPAALVGLVTVLFIYLAAILCAPNWAFLPRRLNGLIQLSYSLVIGYALFMTVTKASRRQMSGLFLGAAVLILIGCLLETYGGFRPVSDAVRSFLYKRGLYENDLRDLLLYRQVRPKFFASEPASVTFCFSLFTFIWFVLSRWRWKLALYIVLIAVGVLAMPGPTLLLMLLLVLPYMLFLASRQAGRLRVAKMLKVAVIAVFFLTAFAILAQTLYPKRFEEVTSGNDPSFFYRVRGPAMAGLDTMLNFPLAGAGLTGEPFIEKRVINVYARSPAYSVGWEIVSPATELVINYFWLHWVYLGLVFGILAAAAVTVWLIKLGVSSAAFCWMVWAILGQASGAYVGPTCWAVLFLSAAATVLYLRPDVPNYAAARARSWTAPDLLRRQVHLLRLSRLAAVADTNEPPAAQSGTPFADCDRGSVIA